MKLHDFITNEYQAKAEFYYTEDEINQLFAQTYRNLLPLIQIPGFRKGKAPIHMSKQYINQEKMMEDIFDHMIRKSIDLLINEKPQIEFIYPPSLNSEDLPQENHNFFLKLLFDVFPEIDISSINQTNLKIEQIKNKEDFEKETINALLDANACFNELTTIPKEGHYAIVEYSFESDSTFSKAKTAMIELGKQQLFPDIDQDIMKMKIGEEKILSYQSDDDKEETNIKVKMIGFKEKLVPELSQEFLDSIHAGKTLEDYHAQVSLQAQQNYEAYLRDIRWSAFFEAWFKDNLIENLPESILEHYMDQSIELFKEDLAASKITLEEFFVKTNKTEESLKEELKPRAVFKANVDLLIRSVVKNHPELLPDQDEINRETNEYLGKFKSGALDRKKVMEYCENVLRRKNALDWILSQLNFDDLA